MSQSPDTISIEEFQKMERAAAAPVGPTLLTQVKAASLQGMAMRISKKAVASLRTQAWGAGYTVRSRTIPTEPTHAYVMVFQR